MFSLNRIDIIGYQTQPVTVRSTPSGTTVTDLNLVVPTRFTADNGEVIQGKSFHTVTLWGAMADIAGQYVKPGSHLFISGRLQTDSWDDPQTNEKKSKTKVIGLDMILLDSKDGQSTTPPLKDIGTTLNTAQVIGNLTKDPEIRTTTSGQSVVSIGIATNERWKEKATNEQKERVEFHNIVIWGNLAKEVAATLKKGQKVYVSGRVQTRAWETQTGQKRTTTEIIAERVSVLGVQNTEALSSVQADSGYTPSSVATPEQANAEAPQAASQLPSSLPEISYQSDIKPEDLPF